MRMRLYAWAATATCHHHRSLRYGVVDTQQAADAYYAQVPRSVN